MTPHPFSVQPLPPPSRFLALALVIGLLGIGCGIYILVSLHLRQAAGVSAADYPYVNAYMLVDTLSHEDQSLEDILHLGLGTHFVKLEGGSTMPTINSSSPQSRWYRFDFTNPDSQPHTIILDLVKRTYDQAILYSHSSDQDWDSAYTGLDPDSSHSSPSPYSSAFEIQLQPHIAATAYLYVLDYYRLPTDFHIWAEPQAFIQHEQFILLKRIGYLSLLIGLVAHGLFLYAMLRERAQIHYMLFAVLIGCSELVVISNLLSFWSLPNWPFQEILILIFFTFSTWHLCLFVDYFLDIKKKDRPAGKWVQWLKCITLLTLLPLPLVFFPQLGMIYLQGYLYTITGIFIALFLICVRRWWAGRSEAAFFLLAFAPWIIALLIRCTRPEIFFIRDNDQQFIFFISNGLCLIFLSFATVYRHRLALEQKAMLQDKYRSYMEREVEVRTRVLQKTSNDLATTMAERDRIITIIGHDLRSPTTSLQSLTCILAEKADSFSREELIEIAHEINQTCSLQLELLNNLLIWGNIHSSHWLRQAESIQLRDFVAEVWGPLQGTARTKQISFANAVGKDLYVFADVQILKTLLHNLISNALKFTEPGGRIEAKAFAKDSDVEIQICDNGIGISAERLNTLFEARVSSTAGTIGEKGIGIGLHICKDLAQSEGGKLWLESVPGQGATAYLLLPAASPHISQPFYSSAASWHG